MKFTIPINDVVYNEEGLGSQTCKVVDVGDVSLRTAKKKLRIVLKEWGVPAYKIKQVLKEYF